MYQDEDRSKERLYPMAFRRVSGRSGRKSDLYSFRAIPVPLTTARKGSSAT